MSTADQALDERSTGGGRTVTELLRILWERLLLILLTALVCVVAADAISLTSDKTFRATSQVVFRDPAFARTIFGTAAPFQTEGAPEQIQMTNIAILDSPTIASLVHRRLGLPRNADVEEMVEVTAEQNSNVATIEAETTDPMLSARIANAYATEYIAFQREADREKIREAQRLVEQSLATATAGEQGRLRNSLRQLKVLEALQTGNAEQVVTAQPARKASSPKPVQTGLLAGFVGLVLGAGLALLADLLD
ncbi:MAG: Wzz/FepE/Etk N-terminal domain-containing protein, partial [Actinomycetota bacterium]|nr:Wzz/FepE/Etk N-terminal domain-containing protein [Actinomycetota bacterium]